MSELIYVSWPGWETTRLIGRGSFGAVYEIQRGIRGRTEHAALKVISIPHNKSEIHELRADGYDDESITQYFADSLEKIEEEYAMMADLKGHSNVVYCDDIRTVQHDDGFGWDIYIKMELLTPVKSYLSDKVTDAQVIKLGMDICDALELCEDLNIVHRDIKPENIFVSRNGNYKLGDFGIAKIMEGTTGGTKTGTYDYMSPEVYNNLPYHTQTDIYSLGLVMYWLLNNRTAPFLPTKGKKPTPSEKSIARDRRFSGERILTPLYGSERLQEIVLKACAFDPKERYQSAREMREALAHLSSGIISEQASGFTPVPDLDIHVDTDNQKVEPVTEKTSFDDLGGETVGPVFQFEPSYDTDNLGDTDGPQFPPRNKKNSGQAEREQKAKPKVAIVIIVTMICILCGIVFFVRDKSDSKTDDPTLYSHGSTIEEDIPVKQPPKSNSEEHIVVTTEPPKTPSEEDLIPFGNKIAYPKEESYLDSYETKYVKAPKGNSIYVFWNADGPLATSKRPFYLYEGDVVTVLAREKTRSCVIFTDTNGEEQVGWVSTNYLVE